MDFGRQISYYKRPLPVPPALASFSSPTGQTIFSEALQSGHMKQYFGLAGQFRTQDEPAYCGLSSLVMALNAMEVDTHRLWKGVWRWFHEDQLDCCVPLSQIQEEGMSLGTFNCLAECNGAKVVKCVQGGTLEEFEEDVKWVSSSPAEERTMILNYSRQEFGQTGDGHFSPMGGYHPDLKALLIMDVARFKFPAHWVELKAMHKSLQRPDPSSESLRGYVILEPAHRDSSILFTFRSHPSHWQHLNRFLRSLEKVEGDGDDGTSKLKIICEGCEVKETSTLESAVRCFVECLPKEISDILTTFDDSYSFPYLPHLPVDHTKALEDMKRELESTELYQVFEKVLKSAGNESQSILLSCMLMLAMPLSVVTSCSPVIGSLQQSQKRMLDGLSEITKHEIHCLNDQIQRMMSMEKNRWMFQEQPPKKTSPGKGRGGFALDIS